MSDASRLRLAREADLPALGALIEVSVAGLSAGYYTSQQIESALRHVFGADTQLIRDGTYYVAESDDTVIAAGGWSYRRTPYGGDQMKTRPNDVLDPTRDAARIRAFFVHPAWARRGLARALFDRCATAAMEAGYRRLELTATLPGVPFYASLGFLAAEHQVVVMPDGEELAVVRMEREIGGEGTFTRPASGEG